MYNDLPGIYNDLHQFEKIVNRFGFKTEEFVSLLEPKMKDSITMAQTLNRLYKSNPHETIFTLICFATHGMILDGR